MSTTAARRHLPGERCLEAAERSARPSPTEGALRRATLDTTRALLDAFPADPHLRRLVDVTVEWGIRLAPSPVDEQWLYHPAFRTLFVWEPDLTEQPLLYLTVILSHELGHALDFDRKPGLEDVTRGLHWSDVPDWVEESAFVQGFLLLHRLGIPVPLDVYTRMVEEPMGSRVRRAVASRWACCLLSARPESTASGKPAS